MIDPPGDRKMKNVRKGVQSPGRKVHQMQTVRILADAGGWAHMGGWGWSMALTGGLVMISIVALVVWTVVYSSLRSKNRSSDRASTFLDERYASGEINRDEYLRSRTDLER